MESEFFGYVEGAFTGANPQGKPGFFELAEGGTLFLDEIGDLPAAMQSKLLRALESGEVTRLGDTQIRKFDVRLIAATNRNLKEMIAAGQFRRDLYFRINVVPIQLPRLAARREDIIPLASFFLEELNRRYGQERYFTPQAKNAFLSYDWPGNIRELRGAIYYACAVADGPQLRREDLPPALFSVVQMGNPMEIAEKSVIAETLRAEGYNKARAAGKLAMSRSTLYKKMRQYGL